MEPDYPDPRALPNFIPEIYPLSDGEPAPAATEDFSDVESGKLQFLAVYYHLNVKSAELQQAIKDGTDKTPLLKEVEKILVVRDQLEDEFTSIGLLPETVVEAGIVKNLRFLSPPAPARTISSAFVAVGLPDGIGLRDP